MDPSLDPPHAVSDTHGSLMSASSSSTSIASPPPAKRRRTAAGLSDCCRTCRLRKVKCTGNPGDGPCTNCARLELSCPFAVPGASGDAAEKVSRTTPSHSHTEAGTLRKRAQRACSQCHAHKTKCSGDLPRCKRCEAGGLNCEYTPARRKFANVRVSSPTDGVDGKKPSNQVSAKTQNRISINPNGPDAEGSFPLMIDMSSMNAEDLLVRKDLILRHLDAYFKHVYYMPSMGFFHPATTYRQVEDGTFDPATAAAMCAVASFFVNPGEAGREFGLKCSDQVEFHIFRNIYRFAEETLILYALNGVFNFLNGSLAKVWQCFGIAVRLMVGLQVNWDVLPRNRSFIQQECLRRICWQLFYMDRMLAGGYDEYIACRDENMKIRLPCNDLAFREGKAVAVERLHEKQARTKGAMGIHGYQLRLIHIRHRILSLTKKLAAMPGPSQSQLEPSKVMADINTLQNELSRFNASLPEEYKLGDQNIARHVASEERVGYVFLHTHLGAAHIDLYRTSLPGLQEQIPVNVVRKLPREFMVKSQKQTVAHALSLARFCEVIQYHIDQLPEHNQMRTAGDPTIVNISTQCLRVLLTALQNNLYQDLADHTTAPLWRSEAADEAHIRRLVDSLLRVIEPWCKILPKAQQLYDSSKAAVEQFNRTRKFSDQKAPISNKPTKTNGNTRLPGPHHILENAFTGTVEDERRSKAGDAAAADRWFRTPQPPSEPIAYPLHEVGFDVEYGPPGVPMLLAQARGVSLVDADALNLYDAANDLLSMSHKMMPVPDFGNGVIPTGNPQLLTPEGVPLMQMDGAGESAMFHPQPAPPPHPQFMPPQHGMFMEGYPGQYADGHAGPSPYMQQGFG